MAKTSKASGDTLSKPTEQQEHQIRELAYRFFLERGAEPGREWDDWLRAEAEVLESRRKSQAA